MELGSFWTATHRKSTPRDAQCSRKRQKYLAHTFECSGLSEPHTSPPLLFIQPGADHGLAIRSSSGSSASAF